MAALPIFFPVTFMTTPPLPENPTAAVNQATPSVAACCFTLNDQPLNPISTSAVSQSSSSTNQKRTSQKPGPLTISMFSPSHVRNGPERPLKRLPNPSAQHRLQTTTLLTPTSSPTNNHSLQLATNRNQPRRPIFSQATTITRPSVPPTSSSTCLHHLHPKRSMHNRKHGKLLGFLVHDPVLSEDKETRLKRKFLGSLFKDSRFPDRFE